jgi:hypothetical protein
MKSTSFHKISKIANPSQKLAWAVVAVYLFQVDIYHAPDQSLEPRELTSSIVRLQRPGLFDKFNPLFAEIARYLSNTFDDHSARDREDRFRGSIDLDLRLPSVEEAKEAGTPDGPISSLAQEMCGSSASNTAADPSAQETRDYRKHIWWHIIAGIAGGIVGGLAGGWDISPMLARLTCLAGAVDLKAVSNRTTIPNQRQPQGTSYDIYCLMLSA